MDTVPFGCYRREVFEKIGVFDEEMIRNQDDEFNSRLICAGGRILLVPDIVCRYYARDSLKKLWNMFYQYGYFKPLALKKLRRLQTFRQLAPPALIFCLLIAVLLSPWTWWARATLCFVAGTYATFVGLGTLQVATYHGIPTALASVLVFFTLHFGYGFGYLVGIWDFWIRWRRRPRQ